jgi:hypothetical protein
MIVTIASIALALQLYAPLSNEDLPVAERVQYGVPVHPPPCGHGWDVSARDGMCYPNGYLPPQEQAARRYGGRYYGGGRYPVPCGDGADVDIRDGQCYPNGTVPRRFQNRPRYYDRY